jgi:hypothetical protein
MPRSRMVTVMVLPAGNEPIYTTSIDANDPGDLSFLVGGTLSSCSLPRQWRNYEFYAFCEDSAMIRPDPPEMNQWAHHLGHAYLRGPVVIIKTDVMGETRSLSPANVANLELLLAQQPSKEALESARREAEFWKEHPSGMAILNEETGKWE